MADKKQNVNATLQSIVDKGKELLAQCKTIKEKEEVQKAIDEAKKALAKGTCVLSEASMCGIDKLRKRLEQKIKDAKGEASKQQTAHKVLTQVHGSLEKLVGKLKPEGDKKAKSKPKAAAKDTTKKETPKKKGASKKS